MKLQRCAIYIRVSTAEQMMHGKSLEAQQECLEQYASEHNMVVVGVYADKGKIQQVIYNLLDNAIKFSNNESEIIIETTDRHHSVLISVRDNGIGIPKQSLPKIWDRFYRADSSRSDGGTGLGLSFVREIAEIHGAKASVESQKGVGSEFKIIFKKI